MIRVCSCGRKLAPAERLTFFARRPCPECGARVHRWERQPNFLRRLFSRRKSQDPRYTPEHPGPRFFSADYGFHLLATVLFAKPTEPARELFVRDELRLTRNKNRWRFWNL